MGGMLRYALLFTNDARFPDLPDFAELALDFEATDRRLSKNGKGSSSVTSVPGLAECEEGLCC